MSEQPGRIAVVGIGLRYPDAATPDEFWQTVVGRRRAFRALPPQRLDLADYGGGRSDVDRTYVRRAAVLRSWTFDRTGFRVPGQLYRSVDLTHWLALEVAGAALADAGFPAGGGLNRDEAGVYLGNSLTGEFSRAAQLALRWPSLRNAVGAALEEAGVTGELADRVLAGAERTLKAPFPEPDGEMLAGGLANTIAGRICNHYDLHGGGYTVDGACSSSLLAVITACDALAAGRISFALAGGVDLSLDPFELIGFARIGALADGDMRVYDAEPTGFLPGEGCGIVALMRAADADRLGLRCYARLVGWGMSSDGAGGITRPEAAGQALALRRAYACAGLEPAAAGLVEGHGTGTAVGDQAELAALLDVRGPGASAAALGSVKANIGHTKAAAGAAGLIKVALAVFHRTIPPMTGTRVPHPLLSSPGASLRLPAEPETWPADNPVAGVSSAGFGGINAHVVVDSGVRPAPVRRLPGPVLRWAAPVPEHEPFLLTATGLDELAGLLDTVASRALLSDAELHDLAATLTSVRAPGAPVRAALVAADPAGLVAAAAAAKDRLADWDGRLVLDERAGFVLGSGPGARVGLLLPGQAAPVRDRLGVLGTLLPAAPPAPGGVRLVAGATDTAIAQPAVVWQSLAGLAWLRQVGCRPVAAVGHSLGELTALAWAGALDERQVLDLAVGRGRLMAEHATGGTGMLSLPVPPAEAAELAAGTDVVTAAENGPATTVLAGRNADLDTVATRAGAAGVPATRLAVSHGFHSPAMAPVAAPWRELLRAVRFSAPRRTVISTVTGGPLDAATDLVEVLATQLTAPVRFVDAVRALAGEADLLVEAGPGSMLSVLAAGIAPTPAVSLDCGGGGSRTAFASAALFAAGAADPAAWFGYRAYRHVDLETPMEFLANPCEALPKGTGLAPAPLERPTAPAVAAAAAPAGGGAADLAVAVREHLAAEFELPVESITDDTALLADLHLNSLQVVQLVSAIAAKHGRQALVGEPLGATTVGELVTQLSALPAGGPAEISGIRPWLRLFTHHWVPHPTSPRSDVDWREPAHAGLAGTPAGLVVRVPGGAGAERIAELLDTIAAVDPDRLLVVHPGHPAAAALGRAASAELSGCAVTVVDLPAGDDPATAVPGGIGALAVPSGYVELRVRDGLVERTVTRLHTGTAAPAAQPLTPGEVCLVTGGATGITARCAAALAAESGCVPVVLGRRPADDPEVVAAMTGLGVNARYLACDLTDPGAVDAAVRAATAFGPVRGLLHGAGTNQPRRLAEISGGSLAATMAPKVDGLRAVLDALTALTGAPGGTAGAADADPETGLRLMIGFGSIIGRQGLAGQAEYCVANDWLRVAVERWAAGHPRCRTHLLEWSAWSGVGMAERMRVADNLSRLGVALIEPREGAAIMLRVLTDQDAPVTVLVTGRFTRTATLRVMPAHHPSPAGLRFAESLPSWVPGVEAVTEATLGVGTDGYLAEHRISGVPVLPAVVGLEAMAQAAALTTGHRGAWAFRRIRLDAPVVVPDQDERVIRVAALAEPDRAAGPVVDLAVRQDTDRFAADALRARLVPANPPPAAAPVTGTPPREPAHPHAAYGALLFHSGRFCRLAGYEVLSAFTVEAWIWATDPPVGWFAQYHGQRLLLGDPAAHDATIHALLACVPHRRALPVEVGALTIWRRPAGMLAVRARERWHSAEEFVFDVDLVQPDGRAVARWSELRLRVIADAEVDVGALRLTPGYLGPWLSRRLVECGWADAVELLCRTETGPPSAVDELVDRLAGGTGDGEVARRYASVARSGELALCGVAEHPVGVHLAHPTDLSVVDEATSWDHGLAEAITDATGRPPETGARLAVAARQALRRLGEAASDGWADEELVLDEVTSDGLVSCTVAGARVIATEAEAAGAALTVAVAVGKEGADA